MAETRGVCVVPILYTLTWLQAAAMSQMIWSQSVIQQEIYFYDYQPGATLVSSNNYADPATLAVVFKRHRCFCFWESNTHKHSNTLLHLDRSVLSLLHYFNKQKYLLLYKNQVPLLVKVCCISTCVHCFPLSCFFSIPFCLSSHSLSTPSVISYFSLFLGVQAQGAWEPA